MGRHGSRRAIIVCEELWFIVIVRLEREAHMMDFDGDVGFCPAPDLRICYLDGMLRGNNTNV